MKPGDEKFMKEPADTCTPQTIKRPPAKNLPSDADPEADDAVLENALLRHCQTSDEQMTNSPALRH